MKKDQWVHKVMNKKFEVANLSFAEYTRRKKEYLEALWEIAYQEGWQAGNLAALRKRQPK